MGQYGFDMINMEEVNQLINEQELLIIDLREPETYREGHMENAKNFPFSRFDEWKSELPQEIDIILYCEYGNQSMLAAKKLSEHKGKIYTLIGGYTKK